MVADKDNNTIRTREFYDQLIAMRKEQAEMERRILAKMDDISGEFATVREVDELREKSNRWDALLGTVTVLGTLIATALGIRQQ